MDDGSVNLGEFTVIIRGFADNIFHEVLPTRQCYIKFQLITIET